MKTLILFGMFLISGNILAETFSTRVYSYDAEYAFLRFENGRVAFVNKKEKTTPLQMSLLAGQSVNVVVDDRNELKSIVFAEKDDENIYLHKSFVTEPPSYDPTLVPDMASVNKIFNRMNPDFKRVSECTDRAHVWAHDEFKNYGIKSQKVFIFFTATYINKHHLKWWFHVAPMVQVQDGASILNMVLDFRYQDHASTIKEWSDLMIYSKRECKMTTKFSEYDVNPQTEDCYMIIESMYYRIPADIHRQELSGIYRDSFNDYEVKTSRNLGFERVRE